MIISVGSENKLSTPVFNENIVYSDVSLTKESLNALARLLYKEKSEFTSLILGHAVSSYSLTRSEIKECIKLFDLKNLVIANGVLLEDYSLNRFEKLTKLLNLSDDEKSLAVNKTVSNGKCTLVNLNDVEFHSINIRKILSIPEHVLGPMHIYLFLDYMSSQSHERSNYISEVLLSNYIDALSNHIKHDNTSLVRMPKIINYLKLIGN